jgi:hypothetical protein
MNLRLIDNPINDLRIVNPWTELIEYGKSFKLEEMDIKRHSHIPYIILLIQALEKYKTKVKNTLTQHNGQCPNSNKKAEKDEFKNIINSMQRENIEEENINEAKNFYYYAAKDRLELITPELQYIFDLLNDDVDHLFNKSNVIMSIFFIIAKSLNMYYRLIQIL